MLYRLLRHNDMSVHSIPDILICQISLNWLVFFFFFVVSFEKHPVV